jgi:NADH:ubiquinone oxidoreductase subunit 3 (subunit A)
MSIDDWRYSDQKMKVREQALKVLLAKFGAALEEGSPKYSNQSIYECAQDWVSQGNMHTAGIVKYYEAYYAKGN